MNGENTKAILNALAVIDLAFRTGRLKDQSIIDRDSDGAEAKVTTLSAMVRDALSKAMAPEVAPTLQVPGIRPANSNPESVT